jgi:hypothetical protein
MTFAEYCISKNIDPELFKSQDLKQYQDLDGVFEKVSVESFTQQKLFLINKIRRKYILKQ